MAETLPIVRRTDLCDHVLDSLDRYWPKGRRVLQALPVKEAIFPSLVAEARYRQILLPQWAAHCGVDRVFLVPEEACPDGNDWQKVDWWLAAFLMLECWHERAREARSGPIHSYSFRLQGWEQSIWQKAWVNRIAMFLRAWAATEQGHCEQELFGPLPRPEIVVTHDVDAVDKTLAIRIKQTIFNLFNSCRMLAAGTPGCAARHLRQAMGFLLEKNDWWTLDELLQKEKTFGIHSHFNFYADTRKKNPKRWLLDPSYNVNTIRIRRFMRQARLQGWNIGLHPGFDAWQDSKKIHKQKKTLESALEQMVWSCRQHWLRFSWQHTWRAQEEAGLQLDTTLMFNDRPGFRNHAALCWRPWNTAAGCRHSLKALPTVLMDSHLYDYQTMNNGKRLETMNSLVNEIKHVGGQAAVLWHPHTLTRDYGWDDGFDELLCTIKKHS